MFVPNTHTPFHIEYYLYASFEDLLLTRISFCCEINYEKSLSCSSYKHEDSSRKFFYIGMETEICNSLSYKF